MRLTTSQADMRRKNAMEMTPKHHFQRQAPLAQGCYACLLDQRRIEQRIQSLD
ncbi:hypothetical protein [Pseudomonas gessardii]|uniref:hypothetical protein n=1 Tax=Pseudomonas gessardii TaxID=78544 RepID=UPI003B967CA0